MTRHLASAGAAATQAVAAATEPTQLQPVALAKAPMVPWGWPVAAGGGGSVLEQRARVTKVMGHTPKLLLGPAQSKLVLRHQ